jgi:epoxyqueuosine reductase
MDGPRQTVTSGSIKERALFEGFHKVGIVRAEPLAREATRLNEWLARGYHGEMAWMARDVEKRVNPVEVFPAARSIVVVTLNYYTPDQHQESSATEHEPDATGKVCVDIQPVMDKAWAVRAGLGWIGKHSNVITPEFGSWVFIGELLLSLELEYDDVPIKDHCGTCTLCIDACPTQAITEPYVVDSHKCISYATIELRGPELPVEMAADLSGWVYGCDVCQDVCPWNRFEAVTDETRFAPRAGNVNADLGQLLELTPETYAARFRGSAMKRAKLAGLQRNARALLADQSLAKESV